VRWGKRLGEEIKGPRIHIERKKNVIDKVLRKKSIEGRGQRLETKG
jgi:hypothetical protein